MYNTKKLVTV